MNQSTDSDKNEGGTQPVGGAAAHAAVGGIKRSRLGESLRKTSSAKQIRSGETNTNVAAARKAAAVRRKAAAAAAPAAPPAAAAAAVASSSAALPAAAAATGGGSAAPAAPLAAAVASSSAVAAAAEPLGPITNPQINTDLAIAQTYRILCDMRHDYLYNPLTSGKILSQGFYEYLASKTPPPPLAERTTAILNFVITNLETVDNIKEQLDIISSPISNNKLNFDTRDQLHDSLKKANIKYLIYDAQHGRKMQDYLGGYRSEQQEGEKYYYCKVT
jgi:hypothetical protein